MIVERIWTPSIKDATTQLAPRSFYARAASSAIATAVTVNFSGAGGSNLGEQFGRDHVLVVTHLLAVAAAGAGQTATDLLCNVSDAGAAVNLCGLLNVDDRASGAVQTLRDRLDGCQLVLFERDNLVCTALFSAAPANSNTLSLNIAGFVVPRGNFQR